MTTPEIRTDDLALATTLRLEGFEPLRLEMNGKQGVWVFPAEARAVPPYVTTVIKGYNTGILKVEPRAYNVELRKTRQQLFAFLASHGIGPRS